MLRAPDLRAMQPGNAAELLAALAAPERPYIDAKGIAVVVAHPDDETVGCGGLILKLNDVSIVLITDGAPLDGLDARANGCATPGEYAALRLCEFHEALNCASVGPDNAITFGLSDQTAALHLAELSRRLLAMVAARGLHTIITHAYEGGHPDHDAAAFAVHAAAALRARDGKRLSIIEMPLYHWDGAHWRLQKFAMFPQQNATPIHLHSEEQKRKHQMLARYRTQQRVLSMFGAEQETLRPAPDYDFRALPNEGRLLYEHYDWGMRGDRWLALVRDALRELDLESTR
ncbi:MAG TPA: PIG-L family deacetylase [Xanthobacteraceae bacterium]|nr:PIG-L family deacetylase [Xanthobacteraceae bacterium]